MRWNELFEAEPNYNLLRKRLEQRVNDLWNVNDPATTLSETLRFRRWLLDQHMIGEADQIRRKYIRELSELIRFLRSS